MHMMLILHSLCKSYFLFALSSTVLRCLSCRLLLFYILMKYFSLFRLGLKIVKLFIIHSAEHFLIILINVETYEIIFSFVFCWFLRNVYVSRLIAYGLNVFCSELSINRTGLKIRYKDGAGA